jgi:MFS family permease
VQLGSVWARFKTGFQYLKERPMLLVFGIASHSVFVVSITHGFYLINLYIDNYLKESSSIYAISEVLYSVGALTAGFLVRKVFAKTPAVSAIILLMTLAMCAVVMLATTQFYVFIFLFQLLIGLTNAGIRVLRVTYLMNTIPNDVIGRTESIFNSTNITLRLIFISLFTLPFFNQGENVVNAYAAAAYFLFITLAVLLFFHKSLLGRNKS